MNASSAIKELLRVTVPLAILGAAIVAFLAMGKSTPGSLNEDRHEMNALVETTIAEGYQGGLDIVVDGVVVPYRSIPIAAEVAGRVIHKTAECEPGTFVTQGTLLVEIDPRDYELEVERLSRELDQSRVLVQELDIEVEENKELIRLGEEDVAIQKREVDRLKELPKRIATESEMDQARSREIAARNALVALSKQQRILEARRGRLEFAADLIESQLQKARLDVTRTKITAPVDGVVVSESVEQDVYVQKGDPVTEMEDTSRVEVRCSLKTDDLYWLWQQAPRNPEGAVATPVSNYQLPRTRVTVSYRVRGEEFEWKGELTRYDGIGVDERTRTVPCRVEVSKPRDVVHVGSRGGSEISGPGALVRGMYVTVKIHAQPVVPLLSVPEQALRPGNVVWKLEQDRLRINPVEVARVLEDTVLIHADASGVQEGDKLVISPVAEATEGMQLREQASR
jgi:RND family efflux transporter MFP subunit